MSLRKFLAVHCDHYLAVAKAANRGLQGPEQGEWTRRVEADLDNMRAGIGLALQGGVRSDSSPSSSPSRCWASDVARLRDGRPNYVRAALALPAVQGSTSRMPMRCTSARGWPTVRAATPKPGACWKSAWS